MGPQRVALRGDYLGQTPPGEVPELFAPGIAATDLGDDWPPIFTPDGNEVILRVAGRREDGRIRVKLIHSVRKDGVWQPPVPLWFSNEYLEVEGFLALSPDGSRLLVSTARAAWTGDGPPDRDIWMFERKRLGVWDEPTRVGPSVNSDLHDLVTSVGSDGTLYFDREPRSGTWFSTSYTAKPDGKGGYEEPQEVLCAELREFSKFCVAHDGSYLLMCAVTPERSLDLFVSFRHSDESWGEPINLESINSARSDKFPGLSPDGRYLFFAGRRTPAEQTPPRYWDAWGLQPEPRGNQVDVFWVSIEVIERLRPRRED